MVWKVPPRWNYKNNGFEHLKRRRETVGITKIMVCWAPGGVGITKIMVWRTPEGVQDALELQKQWFGKQGSVGITKIMVWRAVKALELQK